jgi:hypothetical protein
LAFSSGMTSFNLTMKGAAGMKYVIPVVLACALGGCSMFSSPPKTDPTQQQEAVHDAAPPVSHHVSHSATSKGCDAVDTAGAVFTDSNATVKTTTKNHVTHVVCHGHLLDGSTLPSVEVSFKSGDGKTSLTCLDSWHETIGLDGEFTKVCRSKEAKKAHSRHR